MFLFLGGQAVEILNEIVNILLDPVTCGHESLKRDRLGTCACPDGFDLLVLRPLPAVELHPLLRVLVRQRILYRPLLRFRRLRLGTSASHEQRSGLRSELSDHAVLGGDRSFLVWDEYGVVDGSYCPSRLPCPAL